MASLTGLLASIGSLIKVRLSDHVIIDNVIFRLHYRFTSACFFASCVLITAFDLIGNPIDCITDTGPASRAHNTYCWITSTFTIPGLHDKTPGRDTAFTGVGTGGLNEGKFHNYYQWVPFVLFLQGILFYVPHWIWKQNEKGRMNQITQGLRGSVILVGDARKSKAVTLTSYFQQTLHTNRKYAFAYVACEVLNFVNVIGNIFFIDRFLGGAFLTYGPEILRFTDWDQENRTDPIIKVFPRMTKCVFNTYGPSGTVQPKDALCLLALNNLNEKVYILLWFWLITLSVISGVALVYRAFTIFAPAYSRGLIFQHKTKMPISVVDNLVRRTEFGDFFFLNLMAKNIGIDVHKEVLMDLGKQFDRGGEDTRESSIAKEPGSLEMAPILTNYKGFGNSNEELLLK